MDIQGERKCCELVQILERDNLYNDRTSSAKTAARHTRPSVTSYFADSLSLLKVKKSMRFFVF